MAIGAGGVDLGTLQNVGAAPHRLAGEVTFVAGTTGAIGQHTIFTITGLVEFYIRFECTADLTSGGAATISIGNAGSVGEHCGVTTATTIDTGAFGNMASQIWTAATAIMSSDWATSAATNGLDITSDILVAAISGGTVRYYLEWKPISPGATVTLGAELTAI
ncbi:MAG: hypothetical protein IPL72_07400 [Sulfuritalea sp.]|nr:hypothetical protein [Sulfuritalea sp.]